MSLVYPVRINDSSEGGCARGGIDDDDNGDDNVDAVVDADSGARDGSGASEPVGGGVGGSSSGASGRTGWSVPDRRRYEEEHYW